MVTLVGVVLAIYLGLAAIATAKRSTFSTPPSTVSCDSAVDIIPPPSPDRGDRVLFGRVAVRRQDGLLQVVRAPYQRRFPLFAKSGILVRHGRMPVDVIV